MPNLSRIAVASAIAGSLLLSSCATIFNRSNQPVNVTSWPAGLSFKVTNGSGETVATGTTPGVVNLDTAAGYFRAASYTFTFSEGRKIVGTHTLNADLSGWYFGNILIGGLIGMVVVDPLTGSMFTLRDDVAFESPALAKIEHPSAGPLSIVSIDQLSAAQRARLVRL